MRPIPFVTIALAALVALSGGALAAKDHAQQKGNDQHGQHGAVGQPPLPPPAITTPPVPPSAPAPSTASVPQPPVPQLPPVQTSAQAALPAPAPRYTLHGGFVSLDAPPIETAMANVNTGAPDSPLAALRWAVPLLGLVGVGAVVMTMRRPETMTREATQPPVLNLASADARSLLEAGKAATARGALAEAVAWFTQATRLEPSIHVAHYCRGLCLSALGQHEEAYAACLRALDLDANDGAYLLAFARASARTARPQEAMDALGPLLHAMPTLAEDIIKDDAFAALGDHPRFLAMTGRL